MRAAIGVASSLLPIIVTWQALRRLSDIPAAERLALGFGIAVGASASTYFVWVWCGLPPASYPFFEATASTLAWLVVRRRAPKTGAGAMPVVSDVRRPAPVRAVWAGLLIAAGSATAAVAAWRAVQDHPHGGWDAWAIWNPHALFLTAADGAWRDGFHVEALASHPDYPLLLPGAIARAWMALGHDASWVPAVVGLAFTASIALVVTAAAWRERGPAVAAAAFGLLVTPELVEQGASQLADVPLALYLVTAAVLLTGKTASSSRLVLAGIACGCAAWTKNEGSVASLALCGAFALHVWRREGWRRVWDVATDLVIGALPFVVLLVLFKLFIAPPNDITSGLLAPGAYRYWLDPVRVWFVVREMGLGLWRWGEWPWLAPLPLLAVLALVPKAGTTHPDAGRAPVIAVALCAHVLALFVVYVMTPHSVAWHVQTSWPRLVAQIWPTLVWGAALAGARRREAG